MQDKKEDAGRMAEIEAVKSGCYVDTTCITTRPYKFDEGNLVAKETELMTDRRQFLAVTAASAVSASVSRMTSFDLDDTLHVIVEVEATATAKDRFELEKRLAEFFQLPTKVLVVKNNMHVHVPIADRQWFKYDEIGWKPSTIYDANGVELDYVRWCHAPTGIVGQFDKDFAEICRQYPAPLRVVVRSEDDAHDNPGFQPDKQS